MQTSNEWLKSVKNNPEKFNRWLSNQWYAEIEAAERISALSQKTEDKSEKAILTKIASDETKHADILSSLCRARGISQPLKASGRYYQTVNLNSLSKDDLYALGHYAEGMRLARIEAICNDPEMPNDIRQAFGVILKDEQMHEKAFGAIASPEALNTMRNKHDLGVQALGLTL